MPRISQGQTPKLRVHPTETRRGTRPNQRGPPSLMEPGNCNFNCRYRRHPWTRRSALYTGALPAEARTLGVGGSWVGTRSKWRNAFSPPTLACGLYNRRALRREA